MRAMVLAAGLGTRLRPLTDDRPKALVEIAGRSLLEITLTRLKQFGVREVIVNVHHFADMVLEYLKAHQDFGMHIEVSREEVLLDTGGALKKAAWFFLRDPAQMDEPFLLHNVDVISSIDFREMLDFHNSRKSLATLAVQNRETSRYLLFDDFLKLCGRRAGLHGKTELVRSLLAPICREGTASAHLEPRRTVPKDTVRAAALAPEVPLQALAFSGIHVISPHLLPMMQEGTFSIIDSYLHLAAQGENILAFNADQYYWRDLGKLEQVKQAAQDYKLKLFS